MLVNEELIKCAGILTRDRDLQTLQHAPRTRSNVININQHMLKYNPFFLSFLSFVIFFLY